VFTGICQLVRNIKRLIYRGGETEENIKEAKRYFKWLVGVSIAFLCLEFIRGFTESL